MRDEERPIIAAVGSINADLAIEVPGYQAGRDIDRE